MSVRHYITWVGHVYWYRGKRRVSKWEETERNYTRADAKAGLPALRTYYSGGPRKTSQAIFCITGAIFPKPRRSHTK